MNLRKDGGALDSSAPQIETDKVIRVPLRKLTPDEITALSKKHLDEHGHEYKVVATVDDGRTHTGLRREKHLEKDIEGTHCAQCDKELPLDLEARADGFCSDECEKGFSERKLNS